MAGEAPDQSTGRAGLLLGTETIEVMDDDECWRRLGAGSFGRLAILLRRGPMIFPINYAAGPDSIVFRTDVGTKLEAGPGSDGCFEIDGYDDATGFGWSVVATGPIVLVAEEDDLRRLPVHPVAPGPHDHWLALRARTVSGRRFRTPWQSR